MARAAATRAKRPASADDALANALADPAPPTRALPLPEGVRLVHIGPHKTGTTAVQGALWSARSSLLEQGVRHVGASRNPSNAVRAVAEQPSPYSTDKPPSMRNWDRLVREIRRAGEPRLVVSSEFFAWATEGQIRRIVDDLDGERIHVVVTVRPLLRVMPSMWQQNVQAGSETSFEDWLRQVLADPGRPLWKLERHDQLIDRWASVAGVDRVTAVIVDDRDHGVVMRAFEGLLGLKAGTLVAEPDVMNRSLTLAEAEAVRAFNVAFDAEGLPRALHARTMRFGAAQLMKRRVPPSGEPGVRMPGWAYPEVTRIQAEIVAGIRASGVATIGDIALLEAAPLAPVMDPAPLAGIPPDVVGSMGVGLLATTGAIRQAAVSKGPFTFAEPAEVTRLPTYQLFGALAGRAWRSTVGRIPLPRRRRRAD
jgi:hypothetical protein